MAGFGPPPKLNARGGRSVLQRPVMVLPTAGRTGDPPPWPLSRQTAAERSRWVSLWASPQAVAWEQLGMARTVARYCRVLVPAEEPGAPIAVLAEVRQLEDRLGLSPLALLRLRWVVEDAEVVPMSWAARPSARERMKAVDNGEDEDRVRRERLVAKRRNGGAA